MAKPQKHTDKQLTAKLQNDPYLIALKEYSKEIERKLLPNTTVAKHPQLHEFNEELLIINKSLAEKVAERTAAIMSGFDSKTEQNNAYKAYIEWKRIQNLKIQHLEKAFSLENEALYLELQTEKEIRAGEQKIELDNVTKKSKPKTQPKRWLENMGKKVTHAASAEFKEIFGITKPEDIYKEEVAAKKASDENDKQNAKKADRGITLFNMVAEDALRAKEETISPAFNRYNDALDVIALSMQEKAEKRKRLFDKDNWKQAIGGSLNSDISIAEDRAKKIMTLKEELLIDTQKELRDTLISLISDPSWHNQVSLGGVPVVGAYDKKMRVPTGIEAMVRVLSGEKQAKPNNNNFAFYAKKPAANIEKIRPSTHRDIELVKELQNIRTIAIERLTHKRKNTESTQLYRKIVELITDEKLGIQSPETTSKNTRQISAHAKVQTAIGLQEVIQAVQERHISLNPTHAADVVTAFIDNSP